MATMAALLLLLFRLIGLLKRYSMRKELFLVFVGATIF
jgi:hypothetical protein